MQMPYFIRRRLRERVIRQYGKVNKQLRECERALAEGQYVGTIDRELLESRIDRLRTRSSTLHDTWTQEV